MPIPTLADLTTLRIGGPVQEYREASSEAEFIDAIRTADADAVPLLVLGGGSNVVAGDAEFPGVVVRDTRNHIAVTDPPNACGGVTITVPAGTPWDEVVAEAVTQDWCGIEALSGIPGSAGATPVQNVGAYGQEVSHTLASVRVWDRDASRIRTLAAADLDFGYRSSLLKRQGLTPSPRLIVLDVSFQLGLASLSRPIAYGQLAAALGVELGARVPQVDLRAAVLQLRRSKGMVLDSADRDTWSAGSFFTNPLLDERSAAGLPADAPRFADGKGLVKSSAAWLMSHAGIERGWGLNDRARLSTKHVLALTNRGGATRVDIDELAAAVRDRVRDAFGVELVPEPVHLEAG